MNKKRVIMMGIRKITMLFDGMKCDVSIYNRVTKETVSYLIDACGVAREKPNQTSKVDYKCFRRAYNMWKKEVTA